ncbi:hypothetical protein Lfu02_55330 [Longispora fulva]|uniref:Uncharacterized protein n=1 Tax=Longispora fulva TaxID=619741 RepID=A0A8J7GH84_9ACTN|nr:hypothetical protein [Longispora fulva]MBG6137485.1 hypothetical protein [Longispora fulva]GIG61161.1 hypothetical protein Lfu02_55330 [Longispora fulva]
MILPKVLVAGFAAIVAGSAGVGIANQPPRTAPAASPCDSIVQGDRSRYDFLHELALCRDRNPQPGPSPDVSPQPAPTIPGACVVVSRPTTDAQRATTPTCRPSFLGNK